MVWVLVCLSGVAGFTIWANVYFKDGRYDQRYYFDDVHDGEDREERLGGPGWWIRTIGTGSHRPITRTVPNDDRAIRDAVAQKCKGVDDRENRD